MATTVPDGFGVASFVLGGDVGTQPYVTTIGVQFPAADIEYVSRANQLFSGYAQNLMPLTSNALTLQRVSLLIGTINGNGSVESTLTPVAGTRSVQFPPTALSLIARKGTQFFGPSGRGRMFIPGICAEGDVNQAGAIEPESAAIFDQALDGLLDAINSSVGGTPLKAVLISSKPISPPPPRVITSLTAGPYVGWIRGRIR